MNLTDCPHCKGDPDVLCPECAGTGLAWTRPVPDRAPPLKLNRWRSLPLKHNPDGRAIQGLQEVEDFAHVQITYPDGRVALIRGDQCQTLTEFLLSLAERAGEPIEWVEGPPW